MYFILEANNELRKIRHLTCNDDDGFLLDFFKGDAIDFSEYSGRIIVMFECNKIELPDFFEADGVPIADKKLIKAFEDSGADNFQAFPIDIHFNDTIISDYYLFNIVGRISSIDVDSTKSRKFGPSITRIFDLKLKSDFPDDIKIFRDEKYKEIIFISENIKNTITAQNITGYEIREADSWNDSHRF